MGRGGSGIVGAGLSLLVAALPAAPETVPSLPKLGDLNPFAEKAVPLPGKRIAVMQTQDDRSRASWPMPARRSCCRRRAPTRTGRSRAARPTMRRAISPSAAPRNEAWSADAGTGSSSVGRVTASPIVYDGPRLHARRRRQRQRLLDLGRLGALARLAEAAAREYERAAGSRSAAASGGGGYGGGLAVDGGRLYAASGYGNVVALDPADGQEALGEAARGAGALLADGGRRPVFVVTLDGTFFCLAGADGGELWSVRGLPQQASLINNASPAVEGDIVVVPYPSGDLVALKVADGSAVWSENLSRTRTTSQLTSMSDAARPAIDSGTVFAVGHAGRMIATQAATGERLWSLNVPGTQPPWVAGEQRVRRRHAGPAHGHLARATARRSGR